MTEPLGGPGSRQASAPQDDARARLRKAAHDLEGVFVNELFKAMRETVPDDGILSKDPGQDLFTGMLDERLAQAYSGRGKSGIGEALYRQLSRRLPDPGSAPGAP